MNERIRELMVKSGAYDHYEVNEGVDGDELPMVKFAELIIAECISACATDRLGKTASAEESIKKHFGVE